MGLTDSRPTFQGNLEQQVVHLEQRVRELENNRYPNLMKGFLAGVLMCLFAVFYNYRGFMSQQTGDISTIVPTSTLETQQEVWKVLNVSQGSAENVAGFVNPAKKPQKRQKSSYCASVQDKKTLSWWEFPINSNLCKAKMALADGARTIGVLESRLYLDRLGHEREYLDWVFSVNPKGEMTALQPTEQDKPLMLETTVTYSGLTFQKFVFGLLITFLCAAVILLQWIILPGFLNPISTAIPVYALIMTALHHYVTFSHGFFYLLAALAISLPVFFYSLLVICVDTWVDSQAARWIAGVIFIAYIISKLFHPMLLWYCAPVIVSIVFYGLLRMWKKPHITFIHELLSNCILSCYLMQTVVLVLDNPFDLWPSLVGKTDQPGSWTKNLLVAELIHLVVRTIRPFIRDLRYY